MKRTFLFIILLIAICSMSVSAEIINIPDDFPTIQAGIDTSVNGDTILVQTGVYIENINFNGHNIVLGSLFLLTGDTAYISITIIDGDSSGAVVTFENDEDSSAVITGFTIRNGYTTERGGGINCNANLNPTISYNIITGNSAELSGGGISCYNSRPIINNNTISGNSTNSSGGGIFCRNSTPLIINNIIIGNEAVNYGGGIECINANPTISSNTIAGNMTNQNGGGIDCYNSSHPSVVYNIISGNNTGITGNGGGISCLLYSNPDLQNNIIKENSAGQRGGGIYCTASNPTITNNTIYKNSVNWYGGGIYCNESSPIITNTILWNNTALSGSEVYVYIGDPPTITYSDVQGGWIGEGNIDCNPWFCYPDTGNFDLVENSCCLSTGQGGSDIGAFGVGCGGYQYLPGDANMYENLWPPQVIGSDVTYLAKYFVDINNPSLPCLILGFWAAADINGDCQIIGSDVTRLINYFRSIGNIEYCPDYPPLWYSPGDLPEEAPEGWPNCE